MTINIPDECQPGAPMREQYVTREHLAQMQIIATASADRPDKPHWTELGVYYRPGFKRPFVAVVQGLSRVEGATSRFRFFTAGTLDRALGWFEGSALRDQLTQSVPVDAELRWPDHNEVQRRAAADRAVADAVNAAIEDGAVAGLNEAVRRAAKDFGVRFVGTTTDKLRDALEWLYPDVPSAASLAMNMQRDFGMPARTVRRALAIESGADDGDQGAWVGLFLKTMRCFDRELWAAGQATVASVER